MTVTVVLFVRAVPVLCDTAFAMENSAETVTSASAMRSTPVLMERLAPTEFVMVVSDEVLNVVETVTPWEMAKEQGPLAQTLGFATRDCLPASGTGSFSSTVHLLVSKSVLLSLFGIDVLPMSSVSCSFREISWRWWVRLCCVFVSMDKAN